jgi:cytochrome b involved in lipid metabolism
MPYNDGMKTIFPILLIVVAGILGWVAFFKPEAPARAPLAEETVLSGSEDVGVVGPADERMRAYPMSEVATHKTPENCWTSIRGNVYDVTAWITQHPGGEQAILKTCGIDATSLFEGKHGGSAGPEAALANFKIGALGE